ncbi:hypothetical protein PB2503_00982 [Parvularcula bermudensis HTCC2503]|uniref:Lipoprotein n=1 Tax=Parvularcula bermudensis (strain ATCC BAA-594 / HTCC2503 / KCTC 12087) TaxID=314260 RepID=E0TB73_PARBH|nr:hypothetical protein [Parvularcula bermudensis]ADM08277.1 hypothetical protein PB2503_00982 [Parvularcula bermudensis HTCC2503]
MREGKGRSLGRLLITLSPVFALSACASVKVAVPGYETNKTALSRAASEHLALKAATEELADHPWQDVSGSGFVSFVFGTDAEIGRQAAIDAYVDAIQISHEDPVEAVVMDADKSLSDARRVVEVSRQTADAILPLPADIAAVERAIGDARLCRRLYVSSLEVLEREGADVSPALIRDLRDAYSQTISDLSQMADLVALRVAETGDRTVYAQPGTTSGQR